MPQHETGDSSEEQRRQLVASFHAPLLSFFQRRSRNRAEAEDLTQEVLLRVMGVTELERVVNAESFVFKIAINLLRDQKRKLVRQGTSEFVPIDAGGVGELERGLVEDCSPERVLLGRDALVDVLRTLDELGERTRSIFVLFRLENMKQKDIAALYGIAQSTVEKHVMKAVLHLATRYRQKGGGNE